MTSGPKPKKTDVARPNIVLILADQLRADFLGCYGGAAVPTPNIDQLARRGTRYSNALSPSPLCVPARTSLLTGMNALRNGVLDNLCFLRPDHADVGVQTWPEILSESGYSTAAVGKMHFYPWDASLGFQYRVAAEDKLWPNVRDDYASFLLENGARKMRGGEYPTLDGNPLAIYNPLPRAMSPDGFVGREARRFVELYGHEQPFALMVGFPGPHDPYNPRAESLERVKVEAIPPAVPASNEMARLREMYVQQRRRHAEAGSVDYSNLDDDDILTIRKHYAALVAEIDDEVGQIMAAIEEQGLLDNTVVIVTSDHGDYLGDHGFVNAKNSFYEAAIRVPLIVSGAQVPAGQVCDDLVELHDVTASILSLARCSAPQQMDALPLPGVVLANDQQSTARRDVVIGMLAEGWMAFDGRWKLHKYRSGQLSLYDLRNDPDELNDCANAAECAAILRALDARLTAAVLKSLDTLVADRRAASTTDEMSDDLTRFGRRGWTRKFPRPLP